MEVVINFFEYEEEVMLSAGAAAEVVFIKLGLEAEDRSNKNMALLVMMMWLFGWAVL